MYPPRKIALERAQSQTRRRTAGCVNQIRHAFRLCQVQFVVQKRTLRKLARFGKARAQFQTAVQQHIHHHRPAVSLKLDDIFTRKTCRCGKKQQKPAVDCLSVRVRKISIGCGTRLGRFPAQSLRHRQQVFPRYAYHAHAAAPWCGSDCRNRWNVIRHKTPENSKQPRL
ncbi:Uncharacterised protein [Neisseria meningitidis]|nr:Uncharacterised protein [Neisseria meningitidis]